MYQKKDLTIGDWIGYHIFMLMPFVNVIVWIMLYRNKDTNKTLKSFMVAQFVILIVFLIAGYMVVTFLTALSEGLPDTYEIFKLNV